MINFNELFILSEVLDKINIDGYTEKLENKLEKMNDEIIAKKAAGATEEEIKKELIKRNEKATIDLILYIVKNLYKVKAQITSLFISNLQKTEEDVKKLSLKECVDALKEIFKDDELQQLIKDRLPTDLKKTL